MVNLVGCHCNAVLDDYKITAKTIIWQEAMCGQNNQNIDRCSLERVFRNESMNKPKNMALYFFVCCDRAAQLIKAELQFERLQLAKHKDCNYAVMYVVQYPLQTTKSCLHGVLL